MENLVPKDFHGLPTYQLLVMLGVGIFGMVLNTATFASLKKNYNLKKPVNTVFMMDLSLTIIGKLLMVKLQRLNHS